MNGERPLFILAGNGPYENRGCEAITRGTTKIIREYFPNPVFLCHSHFQRDDQFIKQRSNETDESITHLRSFLTSKKLLIHNFWKPKTWSLVYRYLSDPSSRKYDIYHSMLPRIDDASAVLSVGGDNYSLDYGRPTTYTGLDDIVLERNRPMMIWGASIGPFDKMPDFENFMSDHLKRITGIFVRESATIDYLNNIGVIDNVHPTADPAFLMDPKKPDGIEDEMPLDKEAIGINLSPLMAKYVTGGDMERWVDLAARIIKNVSQKSGMPVYLIPHVTTPTSNDHTFMQQAASRLRNEKLDITLVPPKYDAAETKWIIGKMSLFAGARTHSTIAALSLSLPTLSLAYSIKARGINQDIFGHHEHCIGAKEINPEMITGRISSMLDDDATIKRHLRNKIPGVQVSAMSAGDDLRRLLREGR